MKFDQIKLHHPIFTHRTLLFFFTQHQFPPWCSAKFLLLPLFGQLNASHQHRQLLRSSHRHITTGQQHHHHPPHVSLTCFIGVLEVSPNFLLTYSYSFYSRIQSVNVLIEHGQMLIGDNLELIMMNLRFEIVRNLWVLMEELDFDHGLWYCSLVI